MSSKRDNQKTRSHFITKQLTKTKCYTEDIIVCIRENCFIGRMRKMFRICNKWTSDMQYPNTERWELNCWCVCFWYDVGRSFLIFHVIFSINTHSCIKILCNAICTTKNNMQYSSSIHNLTNNIIINVRLLTSPRKYALTSQTIWQNWRRSFYSPRKIREKNC